jgi:hypothetical protein
MGLYKLERQSEQLSSGILERVVVGNIDYEKDFESWLENSPNVIFEEEGNTLIWIARQVRAVIGDSGKYPDLLGIDSSGDLVIVELKKGRTPREVIAQALEYASWASTLTYEDLNQMACEYFANNNTMDSLDLMQAFKTVFFPDSEEDTAVEFNRNQKIIIVAEEVTLNIKQVALYLRTKHQMKIQCIEYKVFMSAQGEYIVNTEKIFSLPETSSTVSRPKVMNGERWNEDIKVKDAVFEGVKKVTNEDKSILFSPADIVHTVTDMYPNMNPTTVRCQLIQDCVNHASRRHYPSGQRDLYFLVSKGKYRLFDSNSDGDWDWEGKKVPE